MKFIILTAALSIGLSACSTGVSRGGQQVRLAHPNMDLSNCEYLGAVFGRNKRLAVLSSNKANYAMNNAKNITARMGGNILYVATGTGGSNSNINGDAYRCPPTQ